MRILFVSPRPYLPQLLGGVETTTADLCRELAALGHIPAVMCEIGRHDLLWLRNRVANRLSGRSFPRATFEGTSVYRGYDPRTGLGEVLDDFFPDVLVVCGGSAAALDLVPACIATGVPTAFYAHELLALRRRADAPQLLAGAALLANSAYTAHVLRQLIGREAHVLPPLVAADLYRTETSRTHVTMINPRQIKGGATALALAKACPDIPFVIVEAWDRADAFVAQLRAAAAKLPNVTWRRAMSDMVAVYSGTRVLLVPSEWEETWGRVVTEAHTSGIPALATQRAALPESVGPGGLLVEPDAPLEAWVRALRSLWDDEGLYDSLAAAALAYSRRAEAQPARRAAAFVTALSTLSGAATPSTASPPSPPSART